MLCDPKWEQKTETKADPFTLASLIAWLEKQPASAPYSYMSNGQCLLAQYFTAVGYRDVSMGGYDFGHADSVDRVVLPQHFNSIAIGDRVHRAFTFDAALERARDVAEKSILRHERRGET